MNYNEMTSEDRELYESYVEAFDAYVECVAAAGGQVTDVQQHPPSGQYTWGVTVMNTEAAQAEVEACNLRFHETEKQFIQANRHRLSDPLKQQEYFEAQIAPVLRKHGIEVGFPIEQGSLEWDRLNAKYLEIADSDGSGTENSDGDDSTEPTTG